MTTDLNLRFIEEPPMDGSSIEYVRDFPGGKRDFPGGKGGRWMRVEPDAMHGVPVEYFSALIEKPDRREIAGLLVSGSVGGVPGGGPYPSGDVPLLFAQEPNAKTVRLDLAWFYPKHRILRFSAPGHRGFRYAKHQLGADATDITGAIDFVDVEDPRRSCRADFRLLVAHGAPHRLLIAQPPSPISR